MMSAKMLVVALCLVAVVSAADVKPKKQATLLRTSHTKAKTFPALQPHDTYDEDYPIDNSALTPSQLRYKAQADYAKAVADMKEEEAEAINAKKEAEAELARHKAAVSAAKNAAANAEH